mmetsp:Transcript_14863/g.28352  ORF Transcript_14863/g.28352 Transcript_14863/m.28352 type:complete len:200 (-) Transcript_14863:1537-2136(-)
MLRMTKQRSKRSLSLKKRNSSSLKKRRSWRRKKSQNSKKRKSQRFHTRRNVLWKKNLKLKLLSLFRLAWSQVQKQQSIRQAMEAKSKRLCVLASFLPRLSLLQCHCVSQQTVVCLSLLSPVTGRVHHESSRATNQDRNHFRSVLLVFIRHGNRHVAQFDKSQAPTHLMGSQRHLWHQLLLQYRLVARFDRLPKRLNFLL